MFDVKKENLHVFNFVFCFVFCFLKSCYLFCTKTTKKIKKNELDKIKMQKMEIKKVDF